MAGPSGQEAVDPDSYSFIEQPPVTALQLLTAIPRGLVDAGAFVFLLIARFIGVPELSLVYIPAIMPLVLSLGVARGVAIVLEDGHILDTIVYGLGESVGFLPPVLFVVGMFLMQAVFNLIVPSGSGQALVTLPVLAPLSDLLGVSRQSVVLAYQTGDGMTNVLYPTSGYFMAALVVGRIPWNRWVRFYVPLLGVWVLISIGFLIFAQVTGWS